MTESNGKTSMGLEPNLAGLLCYLGWFITGIIFFVLEKDNKAVRFHAMQSIVVFGAIFVAGIICSILSIIPIVGLIFSIIGWLLWLLGVILWIILMVKAYKGEMYKVKWAGDIAEKQVNK
jgi:uncharacterized membrane protein